MAFEAPFEKDKPPSVEEKLKRENELEAALADQRKKSILSGRGGRKNSELLPHQQERKNFQEHLKNPPPSERQEMARALEDVKKTPDYQERVKQTREEFRKERQGSDEKAEEL